MANHSNKRKPKRNTNYEQEAKRNNYQDAFADKERQKRKRSNKSNSSGRALVPIDCKSTDNDPNWYIPNGQMLKDVASVTFDYPTGKGFQNSIGSQPTTGQFTIPQLKDPGIMVFRYLPCVGDNSGSPGDIANSPLNTAMNQFYQLVRRATSGHSYYEAPDLMMATCAIGSLYGYYSWMVRAYGILNNFDLLNHYTPQTLLYAMGIDCNDLQSNLSDFRTYINQFAYRISAFALPDKFNFIKRQIFMNENIYMDASTRRAQYYMYNPYGFWKWTVEDESSKPTFSMSISILPNNLPGNNEMKLEDIISFGNSLITPLLQSDDIRFMTADIIKAFGEGSLLKAMPIAETYSISPVYNAEVLSQMENATIFPYQHFSAGFKWEIKAGTGLNNSYLYSNYWYATGINITKTEDQQAYMNAYDVVYNAPNTLLNFHGVQHPTPEQVMVATRLQYSNVSNVYFNDDNYAVVTFTGSLATEVIVGASLLYTAWTPTSNPGSMDISTLLRTTSVYNTLISRINELGIYSKFDWNPRIIPYFEGGSSQVPTLQYVLCQDFFDYDDVAPISNGVLSNLHYTALNGLFNGQLSF